MKQTKTYKLYLGGQWSAGEGMLTVKSPYDESVVGEVHTADRGIFTRAVDMGVDAFEHMRRLPSHVRQTACRAASDGIAARGDELARTMVLEMGKTISEARGEVSRAVTTFAIAGEEAKRIGGELMDLDWAPGHERRIGIIRRFPIGVIGGITPFNFPLNLVCHKVAPAIASGNPIVIKPASKTPITALLLAEIIDGAGLPRGALSVLPGPGDAASPLIEDERVKLLTFTGSAEVGWQLRARARKKPVTLELGGNAGVIVADDANLEVARQRIVTGGFSQAGQSCISVQRVYLQEKIYDAFMEKFLPDVEALRMGDPIDEDTQLGPMVELAAVEKVLGWIDEAKTQGAKVLTGGTADGTMLKPTVLTDVPATASVSSKEVFAPVVVVFRYGTFDEALHAVNDSEFGLQAGVFTNRFSDIWKAFQTLEVGGVVANDVPTYRADQQPYGGTKESGSGREGLRYAIEEMTEIKILSVNTGLYE